jgi:hypothetical protein
LPRVILKVNDALRHPKFFNAPSDPHVDDPWIHSATKDVGRVPRTGLAPDKVKNNLGEVLTRTVRHPCVDIADPCPVCYRKHGSGFIDAQVDNNVDPVGLQQTKVVMPVLVHINGRSQEFIVQFLMRKIGVFQNQLAPVRKHESAQFSSVSAEHAQKGSPDTTGCSDDEHIPFRIHRFFNLMQASGPII